ncbi:MAG: hypothetical protein HYV96_13235 [Opitutae bacterium]|nr:hypothetical protein [Opitutae bacterium]
MTEKSQASGRGLTVLRGRAECISTRILSEIFGAPSSISEVEFTIHDTVVNVRSKDGAFLVHAGDYVVVVGRREGGKLKAISWWNCVTKRGRKPSGWYFFPALFASVVCGAAWLGIVTRDGFVMTSRPAVGGAMLALLAMAISLSGFYQRRARRFLDAAIAEQKRKE